MSFGYGMSSFADAFVMSSAMNASTIAEVYVEDDKIKVEFEIGGKDILVFKNILPNPIFQKLTSQNISLEERLAEFSHKDFIVQADGKIINPVLKSIAPRDRVERDQITGEAVKDSSEKIIHSIIEYHFKNRPKTISITPPINDKNRVKANIGFVVYHKQLAVNDFRYLVRSEKLILNWEDPWYSKFEHKYLWRKNNKPISVFIYVEPFEVRKEIIIRPKDIQQHWLDLGLAGKTVIKPDEKEDIKKRVVEFLSAANVIDIDGKKVVPKLDRIDFVRRSLTKTQIIHQAEDIPIESAMLGIIYVHQIQKLPKEVSASWELFNDDIPVVNGSAVDEAGGLPSVLSKEDNKLVWKNYLTNPSQPKLVKVKSPDQVFNNASYFSFITKYFQRSPSIKNKDANEVLLALLKNIYHAFDYRDEEVIYDTLSKSTTGDLLTQIYVETQRSLLLKNQGNVKVRVKKVDIVKQDFENLKGEAGFVADCVWKVNGSVGHWGHLHQRKNQSHAKITVKAIDGVWKITHFEILEEKRL